MLNVHDDGADAGGTGFEGVGAGGFVPGVWGLAQLNTNTTRPNGQPFSNRILRVLTIWSLSNAVLEMNNLRLIHRRLSKVGE
jgi:hypothetical protein